MYREKSPYILALAKKSLIYCHLCPHRQGEVIEFLLKSIITKDEVLYSVTKRREGVSLNGKQFSMRVQHINCADNAGSQVS